MPTKTSFNVRIDEELKTQASMFFNSMGLTLTSAINLFIRQTLLQGELPFKPIGDQFYTKKYQKELDNTYDEMKKGKKVEMNFEEWEQKYDK